MYELVKFEWGFVLVETVSGTELNDDCICNMQNNQVSLKL